MNTKLVPSPVSQQIYRGNRLFCRTHKKPQALSFSKSRQTQSKLKTYRYKGRDCYVTWMGVRYINRFFLSFDVPKHYVLRPEVWVIYTLLMLYHPEVNNKFLDFFQEQVSTPLMRVWIVHFFFHEFIFTLRQLAHCNWRDFLCVKGTYMLTKPLLSPKTIMSSWQSKDVISSMCLIAPPGLN